MDPRVACRPSARPSAGRVYSLEWGARLRSGGERCSSPSLAGEPRMGVDEVPRSASNRGSARGHNRARISDGSLALTLLAALLVLGLSFVPLAAGDAGLAASASAFALAAPSGVPPDDPRFLFEGRWTSVPASAARGGDPRDSFSERKGKGKETSAAAMRADWQCASVYARVSVRASASATVAVATAQLQREGPLPVDTFLEEPLLQAQAQAQARPEAAAAPPLLLPVSTLHPQQLPARGPESRLAAGCAAMWSKLVRARRRRSRRVAATAAGAGAGASGELEDDAAAAAAEGLPLTSSLLLEEAEPGDAAGEAALLLASPRRAAQWCVAGGHQPAAQAPSPRRRGRYCAVCGAGAGQNGALPVARPAHQAAGERVPARRRLAPRERHRCCAGWPGQNAGELQGAHGRALQLPAGQPQAHRDHYLPDRRRVPRPAAEDVLGRAVLAGPGGQAVQALSALLLRIHLRWRGRHRGALRARDDLAAHPSLRCARTGARTRRPTAS
eukprot:scaffold1175_cov330-Prasinococcus_capsulatus_cf.AAC.1